MADRDRVTFKTWEKIRAGAEKGVPLVELAEIHGARLDTIKAKSGREGWATPRRLRIEAKKRASIDTKGVTNNFHGESVKMGLAAPQTGGFLASCAITQETLAIAQPEGGICAVAQVNPAFAQLDPTLNIVAQACRTLIDAGLPTIEPPRNIRELATLVDVYRKATGLADARGQDSPRQLIRVASAGQIRVARAPVTLEVGAIEDEGVTAEV